MAKIVQGRVLSIETDENAKGMHNYPLSNCKHLRLQMEFLDRSLGERRVLVKETDNSIQEGDILRAVETNYEPHQYENPIYGITELFHIVNLGQTELDTQQRTHYEFGETLAGTVIENKPSKYLMDSTWSIVGIRLNDGQEIDISVEGNYRPNPGDVIEAEVFSSVFSRSGEIFAHGFGNLGGMPNVRIVNETSGGQGNNMRANLG